MNFFATVYLPHANTSVRVSEMSYKEYCTLQKLLQNNVNVDIDFFLNNLIATHCDTTLPLTIVEKFILLLHLRTLSLGDDVLFQVSDTEQHRLQISDVIQHVTNNIAFKFYSKFSVQNITLEIRSPFSFFCKTTFDFAVNCIEAITINDNRHRLDTLVPKDREALLAVIPSRVITSIENDINNVEEEFSKITINIPHAISKTPVKLSLKDGSLLEIVKLFFKSNLSDIYEKQYLLASKAHLHLMDLQHLTPGEVNILFTLMTREAEEAAQSAQQSGPTLPVAPLGR